MLYPAGLRLDTSGEVALAWTYPDTDTTVRALLASAGGARSVRAAGERPVRAALAAAIKPFRDRFGAVSIRNVFRYVVAVKA